MPGADLAYAWRGPSTDPGVPGLAASARSSCLAGQVQPCRSTGPDQVTVRPPRRRQPQLAASSATSLSPRPPSASLPQGRSCGTPRAAAVVDLDPDHAAGGPDRDRDRLPFRARAAVPDAVPEQLPSSAASSPHGCPGPSTPAVNALQPAPAPPARPPSRSPGQPPWPSSHPPSPAARGPGNRPGPRPGTRDARPARRPASSRKHAAGAARPWPSVEQPTVRTDRDGARIPSAIRPWTPRHAAPQRYKVTHHGTEKKRPA